MDGTLIDSNAVHAAAFVAAFRDSGYVIPPDRIAIEIGQVGRQLVYRVNAHY